MYLIEKHINVKIKVIGEEKCERKEMANRTDGASVNAHG